MLLSIQFFNTAIGQETHIYWSEHTKLTLENFKVDTLHLSKEALRSRIMITHDVIGFDFVMSNLNRKIQNVFVVDSSWVDTTKGVDLKQRLRFEQLKFDLAEIQARNFRKRILEEKEKIYKGSDIINRISHRAMANFYKSKLELIKATNNGVNIDSVAKWEQKVSKELNELGQFRFENKGKIFLESQD